MGQAKDGMLIYQEVADISGVRAFQSVISRRSLR